MTHPLSPRALVVVGAGGAVGTLGRYSVGRAFPVAPGTFPTSTFAINVAGAFVLGFVLQTLVRRGADDHHWIRLLVGVGGLGGLTTFSTMATELALLWRDGHVGTALSYAGASVVVGVAAVIGGLVLAGYRSGPVPEEDES